MNKIYKVIWSKAKNCYVVASELAKSHTKAPSKTVVAGVLACVLSSGFIMSVSAASYNAGGGTATGTDAIAIGENTSASSEDTIAIGVNSTASGKYSIVIGKDSIVTGENSGAIGEPNIVAGNFSYVIGNDNEVLANVKNVFIFGNNVNVSNGALPADWNTMTDSEKGQATGEGVIALGDNVSISLDNKSAESRSSSSDGSPKIEHVVAIGDSSIIGEENAIAIGHAAKSTALNTFAIGDDAWATAEGANAIGHSARATSSFANALGYQSKAIGEGASAFGQDAQATVKFATAFGRETRATAESATAVGNNAKAISQSAVAIGTSAMANGGGNTHAVAIGNGARIGRVDNGGNPTTGYGETIAIGGGAVVENTYGTVIGSAGNVTGQNGTAVGASASVTATNAVALGADSVADTANTVSVGTSSATRKIVNVTAGTVNTDASNIGQTGNQLALSGNTLSLKTATGTVLNSVTLDSGNTYTAGNGLQLSGTEFNAKAGTNVTVDDNGINVAGNGVIDNGDTGLISGGTLYDEVNVASNGNYIVAGNTTAQNLGALDDAIKDSDDSAIKSITANGTTVTYTKGDGTTGTFTTQDNNTEYTAGNGLELNGTTFSAKAGTNVTVDVNGISVAGNGTVDSGDTGLISGGTLFTEGRVASNGNYIQANNTIAQNLTALDTKVKSNADAIVTEIFNRSNADTALSNRIAGTITGLSVNGTTITYTKENGDTDTITTQDTDTTYTAGDGLTLTGTEFSAKAGTNVTVDDNGINVVANGTIADGDTGLVSGDAVYDAISNVTDTLDGKANIGLDNITPAGKAVITGLTDVAAGDNVTVTPSTDANGKKTYTVSVDADGAVASGNTGIVTGGAVYDALNGKANVALDNVSDAGHSVIKTDAKSAINVVGGNYATVDKTDVNGVDTYTVNVATDGAVAPGNTKLITGGTVHVYVENTKTNILNSVNQALSTKANVDMNNLSENGEAIINGIAKGAFEFVSGNLNDVTVTRSVNPNFSDLDTVTIGVTKNGEVEENNEGLVTGGKIYSKINETVASALADYDDGVQLSLDSKANVTLNNIDNAGHNVIKSDAKQAINVVGGTYATVAKTDVDGVDTYTVNVATDGQVASGNNKLVTGDTVYNAIQGTVGDISDALDGKANVGLDNITPEGETVVRDLAKTAVKVVNGSDTTVTEGTDGTYKTYAVNVTKNGAIANGNTGIVTGGTVYTALEDKANVSLDNIDTDGEGVIQDIAKHSVLVGDGDNTTVASETDANGNITYKVTANATGTITDGNTGLVDGGTVYNSLNTLEQNINNALVDKADTDLGNITAGGNTVIQNIAKQSVIVGDGENTTVTSETDANGNITYRVKADATGSVQSGDTGLVDGGTVYDAIYTKANTSLNNIGNDGEEVIKDLAKQSINVTNGNSIAVVKTEVNGVDTYEVSVNANGVIADGNTGAVSGDTVYDYYMNDSRPASDGNYITKNGTVGANLTALDGQVKGNTDNITNLKDLSNITDAGRMVIKNNAKEAVNVTGGTNATVVKTDASGVDTYTVNVASDGAVAQGDTKLVTGGTVHVALTNAINQVVYDTEFGLASKANRDMDNLTDAGREVVNEIAKSALEFQSGNLNDVTIDRVAVTGDLDRVTINLTKNGVVEENNEGVVTGGAVYSKMNEAIADAITDYNAGVQVVVDSKANISLDNINDEGRTVIRNVAKDAVKLENGTNTTVSSTTDANGNITYKVNAVATGAVEDGNTDIVSGGVVYDAIQDAISSSGTIEGKANIALDNISNAGKTVIKTQAKSAINVVGENDVTVTKTDDGGVDKYTVSVVKNGTIANGDNGIVTGDTVKSALDVLETNVQSDLDGKANVALDNIDADGVNAVRNIAKTAVTVADGENTTVTSETDGNGNISYKVKANATGRIEDGDTGLVDGGTVYTAIVTSEANTADALAEKANVNLDNITDNGKEVIQTEAKSVIDVVGGQYATVDKNEINGVDTYTVNVDTTGAVENGNDKLVTGGTVYSEVRPGSDGNYIATANTTAENLEALDTQVKTNADEIAIKANESDIRVTDDGTYIQAGTDVAGNLVSLDNAVKDNADDIAELKDLSNITDNGKTVIRDLAKGSVKVINGINTVVTEGKDGDFKTYAVDVVTDGAVTSGNTGIVTGGTVYDAMSGLADKDLSNLSDAGRQVIENIAGSGAITTEVAGGTNTDVTETTSAGIKTYTVNVNATGAVADGDTGLVDGGTVYQAIQAEGTVTDGKIDTAKTEVLDAVADDLANKANVSLDNLSSAGVTRSKEIAQEAVNLENGQHTTVESYMTDGNKFYKVNVDDTGSVADGNTGLVTGGTVYTALQGKLDNDLSSLSDTGRQVINDMITAGSSNVTVNAGDNVTVTGTSTGGVTTYTVSAKSDGQVVDGNTGLVTGGTVKSAIDDLNTQWTGTLNTYVNAITNDLADKANIDMDNLSSTGTSNVKTLAKSTINVVGSDDVTVTSEDTADVKTFTVSVNKNGAVQLGDTHLVTGSTVASAIAESIQDLDSTLTEEIDKKANRSLNNITDAGTTVIKTAAMQTIGIQNGDNTVGSYSNVDGVKTFKVDVVTNGAVASGDTGIVTGGVVYDALQTSIGDLNQNVQTSLDGKANVSLDNINNDGVNKIRNLARSSLKVVPGENTTVTVTAEGTYLNYGVDVHTNGTVTNNDTGIVSGGTVYEALMNETRPANDGNYILKNQSAGSNLTALDSKLKEVSDAVEASSSGTDLNAVHYDDADKAIVTMAGANGTKLTNLQDGDVSETSTDAVTGKQLYAVQQSVQTVANDVTTLGNTVNTLSNTVTDIGTRLNTAETDIQSNAYSIASLETRATDLENNVNGLGDRVNTVENTVTGLGGRVDTVESDMQQAKDDITSLGQRADTIEGTVNEMGGRVNQIESDLVDTNQALNDFKDEVAGQLDGKANADLDNITDAGKDVIRELASTSAKEAVKVADGTNTTVTKSTVGGADVYAVNVKVDGAIEQGNTGIVSGGVVYDALQNIEGNKMHYFSVNETTPDAETYENHGATGNDAIAAGVGSKATGNDSVAMGHGNVASGEQSIAIGTGNQVSGDHSGAFGDPNDVSGNDSYAVGNNNTVSGNKTFVLGNDVIASGANSVVLGDGSDGSMDNVVSVGSAGKERKIVHVADGEIAEGSKDAVNGGQLYKAYSEINNKADKDASNIDVQKWFDKLGTGTVAEGDNGLVKGGTVYTAIQKIRDTNIVPSADGTTLNVGPGSDAVMVDFTNSNGDGRVLTGIVTDPDNPNSAANVGYVDAVGQSIINGVNNGLKSMDNKINKVGAGAAAMASLAPLPFDEDQKWSVSAAVGTYHGEQAGALGLFYKPADNVMLNMRGTFGNGENMAGAGVTIGLEKKSSMGISKVAMAKAMNAQAKEISAQKEQIAEQQRMLEMQQAQIEQLKRVVEQVVAKK